MTGFNRSPPPCRSPHVDATPPPPPPSTSAVPPRPCRRPLRCAFALLAFALLVTEALLFIAQHRQLPHPSAHRTPPQPSAHRTPPHPSSRHAHRPAPSPPLAASGAAPALAAGEHRPSPRRSERDDALRLLALRGELVGPPSRARLCVLMPVRTANLPHARRNVRSWATPRGAPCAEGAADVADLALLHSQSFAPAEDARVAADVLDAMAPGGGGAAVRRCFAAVRFLAARIPLSDDIYTIYPTHNFSGPNLHFLRIFDRLADLAAAGIARYTHFQLMETDVFPYSASWLEAVAQLARRRSHEWVRGSPSLCLSAKETGHINGNALYSLDKTFVALLRKELPKRFYSWAFDVLLGHWLKRAFPSRIAASPHILSISTFQRNRTCCELVQRIIAHSDRPPDGRSSLYLLHTGNIGKLKDSSVAPSMRALALQLQDLFVPRDNASCEIESALPPPLRACFTRAMAWRARLKCRPAAAAPPALLWTPAAPLAAAAVRRQPAGLQAAELHALLRAAPAAGGQLVVALAPPAEALWAAFSAAARRAAAAGEAAAGLEAWLRGEEEDPLVRSLSRCGRGGGGEGLPADAGDRLEAAKQVLQERALVVVADSPNRTAEGRAMLETYFEWRGEARGAESADRSASVRATLAHSLDGIAESRRLYEGEAAPSDEQSALLKHHVRLDTRLYEFCSRLAEEQFRSIVWKEDSRDACSAAEAVGAAKAVVPPADEFELDSLRRRVLFQWDGDAYRVFRLSLPWPQRALQLLIKGKNLIGSSQMSVHILVSHRSSQPSFAEHSFRYLYESRPPHKRAGKFVLNADRLRAACAEMTMDDMGSNSSSFCLQHPLLLWVAFKCRAVAVSELTFQARYK
ncbi:hypothetical protein AB1Y20_006861 [Prymnesium parvum]|uniref:Protein xylosyltransferase n=1 Tax=Prymnesium parvum TaxID=97485 RepID=A0AB34J1Z2_PRYPA